MTEDKLKMFHDKVMSLNSELSYLVRKRDDLYKDITASISKVADLKQVSGVLFKIIETSHNATLKSLENFVNKGLHATFGKDFKFFASIEFKSRKSKVKLELAKNGILRDLDSYGGGILSFLSLIFRIFIIEVCGMRKLLFLDESLSQTSVQYRMRVYAFIRELSNKGYTIYMIMHDSDGINEFATKQYIVGQDKGVTHLREVESYA